MADGDGVRKRGWYDDPEMGFPVRRYWDGRTWGEQRGNPYKASNKFADFIEKYDVAVHAIALFICFVPGLIWLIFADMKTRDKWKSFFWSLLCGVVAYSALAGVNLIVWLFSPNK